jgi:sigma-54 dependent transcriptional regulator, acetoin dehydrogenase operon transcriptional activator AcoR
VWLIELSQHGDERAAGLFQDLTIHALLVPRGRRKPLPPLRERRGDIPLLITRALEQARDRTASGPPPACSPLAMRLLRVYDWPGNVRELFSVLESAAIRAGGARIEAQHLPAEVRAVAEDRLATERYHAPTGDDERAAIEAALVATGGTLTKAAELLGMGRTTLWRKMKLYGIASRGDETA